MHYVTESYVLAVLELVIDSGPEKESMPSPGDRRDRRDRYATDEEKNKRAEQVLRLPFSVDALMSDTRPLHATDRKPRNHSHRPEEFPQHLVGLSRKSEPSGRGDCVSWIPSPIKMSTPQRK